MKTVIRLLGGVGLALGLVIPAAASDGDASLCDALYQIVLHAGTTADPVRIPIFKQDYDAVACGPYGSEAAKAYCSAALAAAGLEFWHIYPWRLDACLRDTGYRPLRVIQRHQDDGIGRGKIVQLSVRLRNGLFMDQRYTANPDQPSLGRYDLVIWRPEPR